jgi:hypothetical protein
MGFSPAATILKSTGELGRTPKTLAPFIRGSLLGGGVRISELISMQWHIKNNMNRGNNCVLFMVYKISDFSGIFSVAKVVTTNQFIVQFCTFNIDQLFYNVQ